MPFRFPWHITLPSSARLRCSDLHCRKYLPLRRGQAFDIPCGPGPRQIWPKYGDPWLVGRLQELFNLLDAEVAGIGRLCLGGLGCSTEQHWKACLCLSLDLGNVICLGVAFTVLPLTWSRKRGCGQLHWRRVFQYWRTTGEGLCLLLLSTSHCILHSPSSMAPASTLQGMNWPMVCTTDLRFQFDLRPVSKTP